MGGLVGRRLGRYEIVELIGAGGMGEVYRAHDTELGRQVAVKVISTQIAPKQSLIDRFERESRTVAQLSHPNILDIHDFGREGGLVYSVTEYLEGADLRERTRTRRLPLSKTLEICIAVANGLAAAHNKGIIHRDIKPENIFVTSTGHVKILDFGIAGLRDAPVTGDADPDARTQTLTGTGDVVGTVGYMSPEQVRGGRVDSRSDIFAFGCLVYELLTGNRAFHRATPGQTMRAILELDPEPISDSLPEVSPALEMIVSRCLEKQPDERFDSARDVAFALQAMAGGVKSGAHRQSDHELRPISTRRRARWLLFAVIGLAALVAGAFWIRRLTTPLPPLPEKLHLAVAEFRALGDNVDLVRSARGLTRVVGRGVSLAEQEEPGRMWLVPFDLAAKEGAETASDYYRTFNTTVVITGDLRRDGDRLRMDIALVDGVADRPLRRFTIEDNANNVSSFQQEPILQIARLLGLAPDLSLRDSLAGLGTTTPESFWSYLMGVGVLVDAQTDDDLDEAMGLLETATTLDPLFAEGQISLGRAYLEKFKSSGDQRWIERASSKANNALANGRSLENAHALRADVEAARGDHDASVSALEDAVSEARSSADAHLRLAAGYARADRLDDAEQSIRHAIFLRPGYWPAHYELAWFHANQGDYETAAIHFREVIACAPLLTRGYNSLGAMLSFLELPDRAREMFERSLEVGPSRAAYSNLGTLYFDEQRFADAAAMFERALDADDSRHLTWGNLGFAYQFGVAPEKAERCFRQAIELGEAELALTPEDPWLTTDLASYHAMLGAHDRGIELIEQTIAQQPRDPQLIGHIAEAFEDLDERDRALIWVERALDAGLSPSRFENRPTLRELVADERYQQLVDQHESQSGL